MIGGFCCHDCILWASVSFACSRMSRTVPVSSLATALRSAPRSNSASWTRLLSAVPGEASASLMLYSLLSSLARLSKRTNRGMRCQSSWSTWMCGYSMLIAARLRKVAARSASWGSTSSASSRNCCGTAPGSVDSSLSRALVSSCMRPWSGAKDSSDYQWARLPRHHCCSDWRLAPATRSGLARRAPHGRTALERVRESAPALRGRRPLRLRYVRR